MVDKSIDHRNLLLTTTWKKVRAELTLISVEEECTLHHVIFIVCTLIDNSYEPISVTVVVKLTGHFATKSFRYTAV